jgi:hypothetical protein
MPQHPHRQTNAPSPRQGDTHQTSVWLSAEEVGWIDAQLLQMKQSGWRGVTRSAFIRALIRASMHHTAPVIGVSNEEELERRLRPRLRAR